MLDETELDLELDDQEEGGEGDELSEDQMLDKLAASFNDGPAEAEKPEVPAVPEVKPEVHEEYVTIKVDGVETKVSLAELKNSYSRQSDYTQKTQALAAEKQQVQAKAAEFNQYLSSIPMLAQVAQTNIQAAQEQLFGADMMALANDDPAAYVAKKAVLESNIIENQRAYQQMEGQYRENQYKQQAEYDAQLATVKAQADAILTKELPGWTTPETKLAILEYGIASGFDQAEVQGIYDHRQIAILNKARLYDALVAKQAGTSKRVQAAPPKVLSAGAAQNEDPNDFATMKKRALKSGRDSDIADVLAKMFQ